MFSNVRRQLRERELAGDGRAGSWARTKVRKRQWQFIRRQWRFFVVTMLGAAAITSLFLLLVRAEFLRGFVVGIAIAGTIGAMALLVMTVTGTAPISMGATAEQWTAAQLRPLKRAGWRVMNNVALATWDIDHILVGPGGLIAVETKWSSHGWKVDPPDAYFTRAVDQVHANARTLRLWHEMRLLGVDAVRPVVFLWGDDQDKPQPRQSSPQQIGDVTVVNGIQAARAWRTSIQSQPRAPDHSPEHVQKLWDALDKHIRSRDAHTRLKSPSPPTLAQIYWRAAGAVVAAISSLSVSLQMISAGSWWVWAIGVAMLAAVGIFVRNLKVLRIPAIGWLVGLNASVIFVAVVELYYAIA